MRDERAAMKARALRIFTVASAALAVGCEKQAPAPSSAATPSAFTVRALTAERSGDHVHLTVTARIKNTGPAPLSLTAPVVQLFTGDNKKAAAFVAPGLEPAVIAAGAEMDAETHWWLAGADVADALTLEVTGIRQPLKSAGSIAFDSLPENKPIAIPLP